jgi:hypothetical protein
VNEREREQKRWRRREREMQKWKERSWEFAAGICPADVEGVMFVYKYHGP